MIVNFVRKAHKDYEKFGIKRGDSYYWWKSRTQGKVMSKEKPDQSKFSASPFYMNLVDAYNFVKDLAHHSSPRELIRDHDELIGMLQHLKMTSERKLNNIPYWLHTSSNAARILYDRIQMLTKMLKDLSNVDLDNNNDPGTKEELERFKQICKEHREAFEKHYK